MNTVIRFFKKYFLHWIPTPLPRGMTEYEKWAKDLIDVYQFPDNASVRFMLAAIVLNTGQTTAYKPKRYFGLCGLAAASKEIAHGVMTQLKEEQQAKAAAEAAAQKASLQSKPEATVIPITGAAPGADTQSTTRA